MGVCNLLIRNSNMMRLDRVVLWVMESWIRGINILLIWERKNKARNSSNHDVYKTLADEVSIMKKVLMIVIVKN